MRVSRRVVSGIDAARGKARFRFGEGRIDDLGIDGPFVTGDQFALYSSTC